MSEIKEFAVGDWIETIEGISQVLGTEKYVVEDFFKCDFPGLRVGETFDNKVVYKIFCDFEGNPRKTKFIAHCSSTWCDPISKKYSELKDKVIKEHFDKYEKFSKRTIEKPVLANVEFSVRVEPKRKNEIVANINKLLVNLNKEFSFDQLQDRIYSNIDGITSKKLTNNDILETNVLISFKYDVLKTDNGRFAFISGKAFGKYCADDDNSSSAPLV